MAAEKYRTESLEDAEKAAKWLLDIIQKNKIQHILLYGDLGAGKTTTVQHIARLLGTADVVSSPTFSLHNNYYANGIEILHSDLYRLESAGELEQTGFFELLDSADLTFIEWADKFNIKDMLERYMEIRIMKDSETARVYLCEVFS